MDPRLLSADIRWKNNRDDSASPIALEQELALMLVYISLLYKLPVRPPFENWWQDLSVGIKGVVRRLWQGAFGGLGARPNSLDLGTGQTNYGLFVVREERARLESMDAQDPPHFAGPMTGDLGMDGPPEMGADASRNSDSRDTPADRG